MEELRIHPSGDCALTVTLGDSISENVNRKIMAMADVLEAFSKAPESGIMEMIPSYNALEIFYDPRKIPYRKLAGCVEEAFHRNVSGEKSHARLFEIPCCYEGYFAPDMKDAEEYTSLSRDEIIRIHSGTRYRIFMLGFLPGFPYLGDMDPRIAIPRLPVPRKTIPAGSVGIGGSQTGIYPVDSPGGWHLIGRTPLDLFNPRAENPILLRAGDCIRFVPIDDFTFYEIRRAILDGSYRVPERDLKV